MSDQPTQHDDAGTTPEVGGHEVEASPPPAPEPEPQAPVSVPVRGRGGDEPRARKSEREDSVSRVVEVVDSGLRTLYRSQLPRMAAALAYRTLFSIIPIFFIALLFLRGFATPAVLEDGLTRILQFTGADQITVDPSGGLVPPPPKPGEPAAHSTAPTASPEPMHESDEDADDPENEGPILEADAGDGDSATTAEAEEVRRQAVSDIVSVLVDRVSTAVNTPSSIWVGFASGIVLIYAALSMLIELEKAFNQIYRAPAGRRFGQRLLLYTFILTYGTLLLVASFYLAESVTGFLTGNENTHFLVGLAGYSATVAISTTLMFTAYKIIPNARVHVRPALAGAFIAALTWEAGKWGFTRYLSYSRNYQAFYGSLAAIPLFLLWVYVTWLIVLFGLQVSHALQTFRQWASGGGDPDGPTLVDPAVVLVVAERVARAFREGEPVSVERTASDLGVSEHLAAEMLGRLAEAGLVHRVVVGQDDECFTLARPPESIDAGDVLAIGERMASGELAREAASGKLLSEIRAARRAVLAGRTLGNASG